MNASTCSYTAELDVHAIAVLPVPMVQGMLHIFCVSLRQLTVILSDFYTKQPADLHLAGADPGF